MIVEWCLSEGIITDPKVDEEELAGELPRHYVLSGDLEMEFGAEPDVSFYRVDEGVRTLICVIEIKGGTDPAGALERYGAATKSFQNALEENKKCQNFFLSAVYTDELIRRISVDRLVYKYYDIIDLLEDKDLRDEFFKELFHFTLRVTK